MSASPDPLQDRSEDAEPDVAAPWPSGLHIEDEESTIVARFATRAHPHAVDPDYKRVIDDLEWGLF